MAGWKPGLKSRAAGIWPAFWTLGTNIDGPGGVGWPACGEIDIMENIGKTNNNEHGKIYVPIHGPQSGWATITAALAWVALHVAGRRGLRR